MEIAFCLTEPILLTFLNNHFLILKMTISRGIDNASGKIADEDKDEVGGVIRASGDFIVVNACDGVALVDTWTGEIRKTVVDAPKKKLRRYSVFSVDAAKTRRTITGLVNEEEELLE